MREFVVGKGWRITGKAISIRQPWAWLIVNGHKDIENRTWGTSYQGQLFIHASSKMTRFEYEEARKFAAENEVQIPDRSALPLGGIVGVARLINVCTISSSPWFFGPYGWCLSRARPVEFVACSGRLGLFDVDFYSFFAPEYWGVAQ